MSTARQLAKRYGRLVYQGEQPCDLGHHGMRWTSDYQCVRCYPKLDMEMRELIIEITSNPDLLKRIVQALKEGIGAGLLIRPSYSRKAIDHVLIYLKDQYM